MNAPAPEMQSTPSPPARRRRRWPWWLAGVLVGLPLLLVLVLWLWIGSDNSLRQALALAARFLPAEQSLEYADVTGSIARGGRIGQLQWSRPGTSLVIEDLQLDWMLRALFDDQLQVDRLRVERIELLISPQPEPQPPGEPFRMPDEFTLPVRVDLPVEVAQFGIALDDGQGATTRYLIEDVRARYTYDDVEHALRLQSLAHGESRLQAEASLHAQSLALSARLAASLRDLSPQVPMAMLLHAEAQGSLAGGDAARIDVALDAREQPADAASPDAANLLGELAALRTTLEDDPQAPSELAQLYARATLHPWRAQPVEALQLRANRLNAGAFHPAVPLTLLAGDAEVRPVSGAAESWDFTLALRNGAAGPWDESRLPLQAVNASAQLTPQGIDIRSAELTLAGDPAGTVSLTGTLPREGLNQARLQLQLQQVNLAHLMGSLPMTDLGGGLDLAPLEDPGVTGWQANADLRNARPGRLDAELLPVESVTGRLHVTPAAWQARMLRMAIAEGSLEVSGEFAPETRALQVDAQLRSLQMAAIHEELANGNAPALSGTLRVAGELDRRVDFDADIGTAGAGTTSQNGDVAADPWDIRNVRATGSWSPTRLQVTRIDIDALGAQIEGERVDIALPDLASIEAHLSAQAPGLSLQADATMRQRSGGGTLSVQLDSAAEMLGWLHDLPLVGERLPAMQAEGAAAFDAQWQGGWQQWREGLADPGRHPQLAVDARLASERLRFQMSGASTATDEGSPAAEPIAADGPDAATASALSDFELTAVDAHLAGNLAAASLSMGGSLQAGERAATMDVRIQMQHDAEDASIPGWQLQFERMSVDATLPENPQPWRLALADGLVVEIGTGDELQLRSTAGELSLTAPATTQPLSIAWEPLQLRRTAAGETRLQSRGTIAGIQPAWLDLLRDEFGTGRLQAVGLGTDLMLRGEWNFLLDEQLEVHAHVQRESGDLWLLGEEAITGNTASVDPADRVTAGIRAIEVRVDSSADEVAVALDWDTSRAGVIEARASTRLTQSGEGWRLDPQTPVAGNLDARLQELAMWGILTPPGWRLQGEIQADLTLEGTVQRPLLSGPINGRRLNVRSVLDGVELHDGTLRAALSGQRLTLEELVFQGGTGSSAYISGLSGNRTPAPSARGRMRAEGRIDWSGVQAAGPGQTGIAMDLRANLERMQVLVRNDRQLTLSGELSAALDEGALRVRGDLAVDRATILLPDAGAPTLGDDVIIVRDDDPLELIEVGTLAEGSGQLESTQPMDLEIQLDLGRDLALHGYGITTRLEGELTVRSSPLPDQPFSVFGEVRTDEGRYRAWGQALNVETGEVAFNGSYENPSLNLLAIRPEIEVRAGVRVTGTLRAPQVELYSDPPLPEAEKLSWVVLGRPTAIGGGEGTSVQRAALSLLAGRAVGSLADDLGVDELGLGDSGVSVGKRISDQLYLTYEAGLSGAASTLYIFYDITRRFTLRGESGEATALDLIYSFDFD